MALPGPSPRSGPRRTYDATPRKIRRLMPDPLPGEPWLEVVRELWTTYKNAPHTVDFTADDWHMLAHGLRLLNRFYSNPAAPVSLASEARRVFESLGFSTESRERLSIGYTSDGETAAKPAGKPALEAVPTPVLDFRRRA